MRLSRRLVLTSALAAALAPAVLSSATPARAQEAPSSILNASYDVARELFEAVNKQFEPAEKA